MTKAVVLILMVGLTGCATTMSVPVQGQIQHSTETFNGVATGGLDGAGTIKLVSSQGAACDGNFVYVGNRTGKGIIRCSDGRTGPFEFVSTGSRGTGYGDISGQRFTFTFGE